MSENLRWILLFSLCLISPIVGVDDLPQWSENTSSQIILVTTETWESTEGMLTCFEKRNGRWAATGIRHEVTVGRKGLGLGVGWHSPRLKGPRKEEGDDRAPAGIFPLEFGFGAKPLQPKHFSYHLTTKQDLWIDDPKSSHYNQWIRSKDPAVQNDWNSFETLSLSNGQYDYVIVVGHNRNPIIKGRGSAIFMHTWVKDGVATSGCTAMEKEHVKTILEWLDRKKNPVLIQIPKSLIDSIGLPKAIKKGL